MTRDFFLNEGIQLEVHPYTLQFKHPAGTSRGVYTEHRIWFITITDKRMVSYGTGEVAPFPNLSQELINHSEDEFEQIIWKFCNEFNGEIPYDKLRPYPSILFGLETAIRNFEMGFEMWNSPFFWGKEGITINGLVWMGTYEEMKTRFQEKIDAGFHCIKIKIGAIDFEKEFDLLSLIRKEYPADKITLRVDANGGFSSDDAPMILQRLATLDIHSIEQPIKAGQIDKMTELCRSSPIPIALDEELIGVNTLEEKKQLLETIRPQHIILKPSLHGGIYGCEEWIHIAQSLGIGYWITSALESNIGLMAIAQWAATLNIDVPQGLGTGGLYTNNIDRPLQVQGEKLWLKGF